MQDKTARTEFSFESFQANHDSVLKKLQEDLKSV